MLLKNVHHSNVHEFLRITRKQENEMTDLLVPNQRTEVEKINLKR